MCDSPLRPHSYTYSSNFAITFSYAFEIIIKFAPSEIFEYFFTKMGQDVLEVRVQRNSDQDNSRPEHHIIPSKSIEGWASYLPSWAPSPGSTRPKKDSGHHSSQQDQVADARYKDIAGFCNPWPSWYKPTLKDTWEALQWGQDIDPCIGLAASHLSSLPPPKPDQRRLPNFSNIDDWPNSTAAQAAQLLQLEKPDFAFDSSISRAKVTWIGHAGVLVQLASLTEDGDPIRLLFDPIFSMRCSPTQLAGPIRTYPPPCDIHSLPQIDLIFISHNHYDHLDYDTIMTLWQNNKDRLRFIVPLANLQWFVDSGIPADRVTELDWWEAAHISYPGTESSILKITCTPAQHSSGRAINDANSTLWCSWFLDYLHQKPYRIFFAGDTGYQFHDSLAWPPRLPPSEAATDSSSQSKVTVASHDRDDEEDKKYPACPGFAEIRSRLGRPDLLLLPIAVGATYQYVRSFVWLPDSISPFPRHSLGLTAVTHMPPWDAVRVLRVMTAPSSGDVGDEADGGREEPAVAIAIHWGTFVSDPVDVLKTLGQLEWACDEHAVRFGRSLPADDNGMRSQTCFLALNHGQSISV